MKIKLSETTRLQIDWLVAKCEGMTPFSDGISWIIDDKGKYKQLPRYSTDWAQGGPIIEREMIATGRGGSYAENFWMASWGFSDERIYGPTPLIAAMRCFLEGKLGNEAEVPEGLV